VGGEGLIRKAVTDYEWVSRDNNWIVIPAKAEVVFNSEVGQPGDFRLQC